MVSACKILPLFMFLNLLIAVAIVEVQGIPILPVRLVNGPITHTGRVEIYTNSTGGLDNAQWGTICDDEWDFLDARVVCHQLGYPDAVAALRSAHYGEGTVPILLDNVNCVGNESDLITCGHNEIGIHDCEHTKDAAVECWVPTVCPPVRLVGGISENEGRVEIYYNNTWGTVCGDSYWSITDSNTVCRQLGYTGAAQYYYSAFVDHANVPVWMNRVSCGIDDLCLGSCAYNRFGDNNCQHSQDVFVNCNGIKNLDIIGRTFRVRLVNGPNPYAGRVEVYTNSTGGLDNAEWGTICDDFWDIFDARVVCHLMGFPNAVGAPKLAHYGEGTGPIWLNNINCRGYESDLFTCGYAGIGNHNCQHLKDASAECLDISIGTVRLVGGSFANEGRVEIFYGTWGTVCDHSWDLQDAMVVCQELGWLKAVSLYHFPQYRLGTRQFLLDNLQCIGNESRLYQCSHNEIRSHYCISTRPAGVQCTNMTIRVRLVNGPNPYAGRVEVYTNSTGGLDNAEWGTICDDFWDIADARVVCHQLGFSDAIAAPQLAYYDQGTGHIWLSNVSCYGNETDLFACEHAGIGNSNCQHLKDASVECLGNEYPTQLRLIYGQNAYEGRVEILHAGVWSGICNDQFDLTSANVVCRQLGYHGALRTRSYRSRSTLIWLSNVRCFANESSIDQCSHNDYIYDCNVDTSHTGVECIVNETDRLELRLVNFPSDHELQGRLEIKYYDVWGTICDDNFNIYSANVACRGLGYPAASRVITSIPQGLDPIWMNNVQCIGNESSLEMCSHSGFYDTSGCNHYEDVGVECIGNITEPIQVQLLGGQDNYNGRVEILVSNIRGTICNDSFTLTNAHVICRQLGFPGAVRLASFGPGSGQIWLDDVQCNGNEVSLEVCAHNGFGIHNCHHINDVGVVCIDNRTEPLPVRLVDGANSQIGRLEIHYNGVWGTICRRNFNLNSANVACRSLGFIAASQLVRPTTSTNGPIWLNNVQCFGNETSLEQCHHDGFGNQNCYYHYLDVGIQCIADVTEPIVILLLNGQNENEGRVHILYNNIWGTICRDSFTLESANVVCRELGYRGALEVASFGAGTGQIWLDELQCIGNETSIEQCSHLGFGNHNCFHSDDVGVKCIVDEILPLPMRLADGLNNYQGRIEIEYYGTWGTVCDDNFNLYSGNVVCRRLGFIAARSILTNVASGVGDIWLDDVQCIGNESSLELCPHNGFGTHSCRHIEDVGVECIVNATDPTDVRLINGRTRFEGRLEIFYAGIWGTVCRDFFNLTAANVVCRQLGFPGALFVANDQEFGRGTSQIWLDDIKCTGNESSILQCSNSGYGIHNCQHTEDVGVACIDENNPPPPDFTVRLIGSRSQYEGRVEIFYDGRWGTVCIDDDWDLNDARVICRQLNFTGADIAYRYSRYGSVTYPTWLGNLRCNGSEKSVIDCARNDFKMNNCHNYRDASVKCTEPFLNLTPSFGNMFGDTLIELSGMTFQKNAEYKCEFEDVMVNATYFNRDHIYCVTPSFNHSGMIDFSLHVGRVLEPYEMQSVFQLTQPFFNSETSESLTEDDFREHRVNDFVYSMGNNTVMIMWNPTIIPPVLENMFPNPYTVDISLYSLDPENETRSFMGDIGRNVTNNGSFTVSLPNITDPVMVGAIGITVSETSVSEVVNNANQNDGNQDVVTPRDIVDSIIDGIFSISKKAKKFIKNPVVIAGDYLLSGALRLGCEAFSAYAEPENIGDDINDRLPPCPPTSDRARRDRQFTGENPFLEFFTVGTINQCYRQNVHTRENGGSEQQCCYNRKNGRLKTGPPSGGSVSRFSPRNKPLDYALYDFAPRILCCEGRFSNCEKFYEKRPSDNGSRYQPPRPPAWGFGDPHIITLDGLKYTFNGKGEFILIEDIAGRFMLQGRIIQAINSAQNMSRGTVFSTVVAKQNNSDAVQFEINEDNVTLDVLVDGSYVYFNDLFELTFNNVIVTNLENNTIGATFSGGPYIEAKTENGIISVLAVSLPDSYKGTTRGLMGIYNDDTSDDLSPRGTTFSLPPDSSLQEIHYQFGLSWLIDNKNKSHFTYEQNFTLETYYDPNFEPLFEPTFSNATLEEQAMETCGDDIFCLFDVAATGRMDIGLSSLNDNQDYNEIVNLSYPVVCDQPCVHGACVENDTCYCAEAYEGPRCTEPVYNDCDINECQNGGSCKKLGVSYICECVNGFSGLLCQIGSPPPDDDNDTTNVGLIAATTTVGVVVIVIITIGWIVCCCFWQRRGKTSVI